VIFGVRFREAITRYRKSEIAIGVLSEKVDRWIAQPFQPDVASYFLAGPGRNDEPFATLFKMIADA
jgi:hypothetical protein